MSRACTQIECATLLGDTWLRELQKDMCACVKVFVNEESALTLLRVCCWNRRNVSRMDDNFTWKKAILLGSLLHVWFWVLQRPQPLLVLDSAFLTLTVLFYTRTSQTTEQSLEEHNPYQESSFYWLLSSLREAIHEARPLLFSLYKHKPRALFEFIRSVQAHLSANWYCSSCGRQLRQAFIPSSETILDSILVGEGESHWQRLTCPIYCRQCSPFQVDSDTGMFMVCEKED